MCDFLIKQVALENETASSGRSDMLGTLSALFNREDSRAIFSARILGFLTSADSSLCAYALSYLGKCTYRNDGVSLGLLSDKSVIAAICKLLRFKISDTGVVESILRTLSFALGLIDTIDADTWGPLFECFGASQSSKFVDKLGVLVPANSTLKSIAGDIIVSVLCKHGGQQLIKAPFFDKVLGCNSMEHSYSPLFRSLWLLKLYQRVSRCGAQSEVPFITGCCFGRMLAAMSVAAQHVFENSSLEQDYQNQLPCSCGLRVAPIGDSASLHPNHFRVTKDFQGTISPIILPSWDSLLAAVSFFKLSNFSPKNSIVCVLSDETALTCTVISKLLFSQVSAIIDHLKDRSFGAFVAELGTVGAYTKAGAEISQSMGINYRDLNSPSMEPLSPEELSVLQTVFSICNLVTSDLVKSLSFDDATGKLIPEAPVIDFMGMKHTLQDCFSIFPKALRQTFSDACIISTIKRNLASPEVTVSRYLARRSRSSALDIDGMSVFAQLMDYFTSHGFSAFCLTTRGSTMPFRVKFKGENGLDATQGMGGLFRECLSAVAEELSSGVVPVLIRRGKSDEFDIDPLLLSPLCASTSRGRSCLKFLGVLMGVAMRSGEPLALDIHSSVWHALVGGTVIHPVDEQTADAFISNKTIASSYTCASQGAYNPDDDFWFELVPLAGGDALVPVNNSMTCSEYQQELLRFANEEVATAVECVRQGLLAVVPAASLFSLSWEQLQANVCGSSSFTFNDLEPFLVRQPNGISDAAFAVLKSVLKSFTSQELSMFLRFCTGLLRLPTDAKSRDGFSIMIRHVIASSARSGRAVPANLDGSVHVVAHLFSARFQFDLTPVLAVGCRLPKHACGQWIGQNTREKPCTSSVDSHMTFAFGLHRAYFSPQCSREVDGVHPHNRNRRVSCAGTRMLSECLFTLSREANAQQPQPGSGRSNHRHEDLSDLHEQ
jgi:E3 ubiquitin-protein ligase HERC2